MTVRTHTEATSAAAPPLPAAAAGSPRWRRHRLLAGLIRVAAFAAPFCASTVVVAIAAGVWGRPAGPLASVAVLVWMAGLLGIGTGVAVITERAARRLFPLASLLQMTLLFPDRAPSRTLTALRAGSARTARALLEDPVAPADQHDAAVHVLLLVGALGRHDRITRGHCERVRAYADLMATQLGLSGHDSDRLRWAALLHDVGKLRVAYATLNKKGKLDEDEWQAIRRHPADGAELIAPLAAWLGPWADAVGQHHERVDGQGYPQGLAGADINLGARIIAVVDAFDVMTASRSYKRPVSSAAARRELQRCAGTQFDPAIVEAFLHIPSQRPAWWAGLAATLTQLRAATNLVRLPAPVAATAARVPALATSLAVGAASLTLIAASTTVAPAATAGPVRPPSGATAPSPSTGPTEPSQPAGASSAPSSDPSSPSPTPTAALDPAATPPGGGGPTPDPAADRATPDASSSPTTTATAAPPAAEGTSGSDGHQGSNKGPGGGNSGPGSGNSGGSGKSGGGSGNSGSGQDD